MDAVQPRRPDVLHRGHSARHSEDRAEKHVTHGLQQQQRYAWRKVRPGPAAVVVAHTRAWESNRRAARARPELKRERQWGLGTSLSAALCCHCQRSPASSPASPFAHFLPPSLHRTQRPLRTRTGTEYSSPPPPPPSHPPPPSPGLTAPGQHLAASIGSTDPPIARLPFWGLATRDKAEGAPPSALQTAHEIHIQHTIIATTASSCDHPPRLATSNHVQRASRHGPAWAGTAGHPSG